MATTFNSSTTTDQVAAQFGQNARGKVAIVTGGNIGLGLETARVLALHGASVVLACRSEKNALQAIETIQKSVPNADVTWMLLDLANQKQVRKAAEEYVNSGKPLHILINNAGIMGCPRILTVDGFETQFGVNHLGHFTFTKALLPALKRSAPARVINLSSVANYAFAIPQGIPFDDLDGSKRYNSFERYSQSKLANILHAKQLQRIFDEEKVDIVAVSLHPGVIQSTNLSHSLTFATTLSLFSHPLGLFAVLFEKNKSIPQGAATTVLTALLPQSELVKGGYYVDCQIHTKYLCPSANDENLAKRLWDVSEQLTAAALAK
eukprot:c2984_g1_i1.p1 GENE.c2984_g1_i1~~c2984_g1_i1.p1  ORF type:complete len:334 (+),score=60.82 c2984_g1_i1:42-1004(+)